jgi:hypothetical protein
MESTFGSAYLPVTMVGGGAIAGTGAYLLTHAVTHNRPIAIGSAAVAAVVGGVYAGVLVFSD